MSYLPFSTEQASSNPTTPYCPTRGLYQVYAEIVEEKAAEQEVRLGHAQNDQRIDKILLYCLSLDYSHSRGCVVVFHSLICISLMMFLYWSLFHGLFSHSCFFWWIVYLSLLPIFFSLSYWVIRVLYFRYIIYKYFLPVCMSFHHLVGLLMC